MNNLKITSIAIIATLVFAGGLANSSAFGATNPYVTGYPDTTTPFVIHSQYTMKSDFAGTPGPRSQNLGQVFSTAGFATTSSTDPTGVIYQHIVDLKPDNTIWGEQEALTALSGCFYHCPISSSNSVQLGTFGGAATDISYVYSTYFWSGAPHRYVNFYYEAHLNNGNIVTPPITQYDKNLYGDTSSYFATGTKTKFIPARNANLLFKFYQFGLESNDPESALWKAKEYELTYNGAVSYNSLETKAASPTTNFDPTLDTWISYDSSLNAGAIGKTQYIANAHSHHIDGSFASGTVQWYKSGTAIVRGTILWP
ncbi:MAG: hypothetical protein HY223_00150 [Thaumarchaeota archaeon]|nr:hypothetical protein [Nitrososphaerota archaeon]